MGLKKIKICFSRFLDKNLLPKCILFINLEKSYIVTTSFSLIFIKSSGSQVVLHGNTNLGTRQIFYSNCISARTFLQNLHV